MQQFEGQFQRLLRSAQQEQRRCRSRPGELPLRLVPVRRSLRETELLRGAAANFKGATAVKGELAEVFPLVEVASLRRPATALAQQT